MAYSGNKLNETFIENCQVTSVPIELLTLVSLLIDGSNIDISNFRQPFLTVSQLILTNFKQSYHNVTNPENQQSNH